jgi:hypothetical protein
MSTHSMVSLPGNTFFGKTYIIANPNSPMKNGTGSLEDLILNRVVRHLPNPSHGGESTIINTKYISSGLPRLSPLQVIGVRC